MYNGMQNCDHESPAGRGAGDSIAVRTDGPTLHRAALIGPMMFRTKTIARVTRATIPRSTSRYYDSRTESPARPRAKEQTRAAARRTTLPSTRAGTSTTDDNGREAYCSADRADREESDIVCWVHREHFSAGHHETAPRFGPQRLRYSVTTRIFFSGEAQTVGRATWNFTALMLVTRPSHRRAVCPPRHDSFPVPSADEFDQPATTSGNGVEQPGISGADRERLLRMKTVFVTRVS